jgi:uncharacterized protein YbjT (DUF2867 family)
VLHGADCAWYLVHSMGSGRTDFASLEQRSAENFVAAAHRAGLRRIVYLGGVAPRAVPSPHLASRLRVGQILRSGPVPAVELRASMIVGAGSASWQIVRDLAMRLPVMVMPAWLASKTSPVALEDVIVALARAADCPLESSAWFDLPGPAVLTGREILERVAALRGRRIPVLSVPVLTPYLSSLWLKLITRADFSLSRELVIGMQHDLLAEDDRFWQMVGHTKLIGFDEAAKRALASKESPRTLRAMVAATEELLVDWLSPRCRTGESRA